MSRKLKLHYPVIFAGLIFVLAAFLTTDTYARGVGSVRGIAFQLMVELGLIDSSGTPIGGGGGSDLATTLTSGNTTGGTNIVVSSGDSIVTAAGAALNLVATNAGSGVGPAANLTAGNGGTAGVGGAVVLSGGTGNDTQAGGAVTATAGTGGITNGTGGALDYNAGAGGGTNGVGGAVTIDGGAGQGTGAGGSVTIKSGVSGASANFAGDITVQAADGGTTTGDAGDVFVHAGDGVGDGQGGTVTITSGDGASGESSGNLLIQAGQDGPSSTTPGTLTIKGSLGSTGAGGGGNVVVEGGLNGGGGGSAGNVQIKVGGSEAFRVEDSNSGLEEAVIRMAITTSGDSALFKSATEIVLTDSGTSVSTAGIIPAGARLVGVVCRVEQAITGPTSIDIGLNVAQSEIGAFIGTSAGSAADNTTYTSDPYIFSSSDQDIYINANGGSFTGGEIRVTVFYWEFTAGP